MENILNLREKLVILEPQVANVLNVKKLQRRKWI
jgi:hypothetical protein